MGWSTCYHVAMRNYHNVQRSVNESLSLYWHLLVKCYIQYRKLKGLFVSRKYWKSANLHFVSIWFSGFFPCDVAFKDSVNLLSEPKDFWNFTQFSLGYMETEKKASHIDPHEPRFGGHQTLEERQQSFFAVNQTIHCGFVRGAEGFPSTGFDLKEEDKNTWVHAEWSYHHVFLGALIF